MSTASLAEAVPDASRARRDRELQRTWAELTAAGAPYEVGLVDVRGQTLRQFLRGPADLREVWLSTAGFGDRPYLVFED